MTSENLVQPDHPTIHQLLATQCDCSKQYNLRQFSLTRWQKCTQERSGIDYTRTFVSLITPATAKKTKTLRCSSTIENTWLLCAQGAHDKFYRHDRMEWHTNSMPLAKEMDPKESKTLIRNFNGTGSSELNQISYNGSDTYFHSLSFQVQIEKKTNAIHCIQT